MEIVDAQIHTWQRNPTYPWHPAPHRVGAMSYDEALNEMDAVGIGSALIATISDYNEVRSDGLVDYYNGYMEEAVERHPDRFAGAALLDGRLPEIDDLVAAYRDRPGILGLRARFREDDLGALRDGSNARYFEAAARHAMPIFLGIAGFLGDVGAVARDHPDTSFIIDHFGLPQPPRAIDSPPFRRLPDLLALARFPNVAVKFSGAPTLSAEPYPYLDLWPSLGQVVEAFGSERLMWASDFTRLAPEHSYADALNLVALTDQLSPAQKADLLGGTVRRILDWPAGPGAT